MPINVHAKNMDTTVLGVIPSPKNHQVRNAKDIIPVPNPMNLPGHKIPS